MIVVTTPTGQIGRHVLAKLVEAGEPVRAIARDRTRIEPALRAKIEVIEGSHADSATLAQALDGAESLFWCVPPDFHAANVRDYYLDFTRPLVAALPGSSVRHVVFVSSGGRVQSEHAGVVAIAHELEDLLATSGVNLRSLQCGYFMENMLHLVGMLRGQGMFFYPVNGDLAIPVCATRDIGSRAAALLHNRTWTGQSGTGVHGPADLSCNAMADILTQVLGRPIRFQEVPIPAYQASLVEHGATQDVAQNLSAMWREIGNGLYAADPRTAESTTPTTFEAWCRDTLKPAWG